MQKRKNNGIYSAPQTRNALRSSLWAVRAASPLVRPSENFCHRPVGKLSVRISSVSRGAEKLQKICKRIPTPGFCSGYGRDTIQMHQVKKIKKDLLPPNLQIFFYTCRDCFSNVYGVYDLRSAWMRTGLSSWDCLFPKQTV